MQPKTTRRFEVTRLVLFMDALLGIIGTISAIGLAVLEEAEVCAIWNHHEGTFLDGISEDYYPNKTCSQYHQLLQQQV